MTTNKMRNDTLKRRSARDRLIEVANNLFYRQGIRAVGVDEVVRQAGVAKVSLYRAFPSKDDLIVAYLKHREELFWRQWNAAVEAAPDALAAVEAVIELLASEIQHPEYRGCPFSNFVSEFPGRDHPGRQVVERSKHELQTRLSALADEIAQPGAGGLGDTLLLLVEGAFSLSQTAMDGRRLASRSLRQGSQVLLAPLSSN